MEEQLGELLRKRTAKLKNLKRFNESIKSNSTPIEIKSATDISKNLAEDIKQINEKVEEMQIQAKIPEEAFEAAQKIGFDIYVESVTILNTLQSYGNVTIDTNKTKIKLPAIEILPFYGDIKDYHSFIERFKTIDDRKDLSAVEKFTYLTSLTKGTAGKLLSGFQLTELNYAEAKKLLEEHYGDEQIIINDYIKHIYNLSCPNETTAGLKGFVIDVQKTLRQLGTLDFNVEVKEVQRIFTTIILEKVPNSVKNKVKNFDYESFNKLKIDEALKSITRAAQEIESTDKVKYVEKKKIYQNGKHLHSTAMAAATASVKQTGYNTCSLCMEIHKHWHCPTYDTKDKKFKRAIELKICAQCYRTGHRKKDCTAKVCTFCNIPGHLVQSCYKDKREGKTQMENNDENKVLSASIKSGSVALPITKVTLKHGSKEIILNTLFDQGAQRSFIKRRILKKMGMKPSKTEMISIDSFATRGKPQKYDIVSIPIKVNAKLIECEAIVASDTLPERVSIQGLKETTKRLEKQGFDVADTSATDTINIDLLIGCDHYAKFITNIEKIDGISLLQSVFGLIPFGPLTANTEVEVVKGKNISVMKIGENIQDDISFLWELDSIGITEDETHPDDVEALKNFDQNIEYKDNKYVARLPWKRDPKILPSNYAIAKKMLEASLARLRRDPNKLDVYHRIISEQVRDGFIEVVEAGELYKENIHYLTHHGVEKESPTTPLRIVFNCSFKHRGSPISLNDCLYKGPNLLPEMTQILMRFRLNKIAIISDIKKAFLQVGLHEDDKDFTRFLWVENPYDIDSEIVVYRYRNVLFGSTASQFLLNAVVQKHLKMAPNMQTAKEIQRNIYVDNILHTSNCVENIKTFQNEALKVMKSANLPLVAWTTNHKGVMETIPDKIKDVREVISVLGMNWHISQDTLSIAGTNISIVNPTKRKVLSGLASQFDPLGIIAPIILPSKILMRNLHINGYGWDTLIGENEYGEWKNIVDEYNKIPTITIPRSIVGKGKVTLHAFSDASKTAYGTVIYAVQENKSQLLISKSKLAPKRELTIPKLELTGVLLSSRLINYCRTTFADEFEIEEIHLYSDSLIANGWVLSAKELPTYVEKRKVEIKENVPEAYLHHISGLENPADILSRGSTVAKLKQNVNWWNGPEIIFNIKGKEEELIGRQTRYEYVCKITENKCYDVVKRIITNCSTYNKAIKIMGWVLRVGKKEKPKGKLDATELLLAEKKIIEICQEQEFSKEKEYLLSDKKENLNMPSLVKDLNLELEDNLLVVVTRLQGASIDHRQKRPYLIPTTNGLSSLLIKQCHENNIHGGINSTLSSLQQKYYLPRARQRIKSVLRNCVTCKKESGKHYSYPTSSQLPKYRVNKAKPFEITGVDFAGPLLTKQGKVVSKRYVSLFTCATTRAVHLEIATDLSSEAFLRAFERFVARRGYPATMISDNATNFVKTSGILTDNEIKTFKNNVTEKVKCHWIFIPARSPWWGGMYERLIGIMKSSLRKAIGKSLLKDNELNNILCKIEACMNDRPLTYVSQDNENAVLTPSMMLYGHRLRNLPETFPEKEELLDPTLSTSKTLSKRQTYLSSLLGVFWERWKNEYLPSLKLSQKDKESYVIPKINDVVLIDNDGRRFTWPMGCVTELIHSKDNKIRVVKVKTKNGEITRPISKLYPLEVQEENEETTPVIENDSELLSPTIPSIDTPATSRRLVSPRSAALKANRAFRDQLSPEHE